MKAYYLLFSFISLAYLAILIFEIGVKEGADELQNEKAQNRWMLILAFIPIIVLTALRSGYVGTDTPQYLGHFERICMGVEGSRDIKHFEWGYRYFVHLIAHFTHSKVIFLSIMALITNIPIAIFIMRYSKDAYLSVMLYLTIGSFAFQLTGIRQAIALSILTVAVDFAIRRKPIWFLLCIYVASTFHRSALLFAPVYLLSSDVISRRTFFMIVLSALVVAFSDIIFTKVGINLRYDGYFGEEGVTGSSGWTYIAIMLLTMGLYLISRHYDREMFSKTDQVFFVILLFAFALYVLRYQNRIAERVSLYYRTALIILLPNSIYGRKNISVRSILAVGCTFFAIALFIYWTIGSPYIYHPFWSYMNL